MQLRVIAKRSFLSTRLQKLLKFTNCHHYYYDIKTMLPHHNPKQQDGTLPQTKWFSNHCSLAEPAIGKIQFTHLQQNGLQNYNYSVAPVAFWQFGICGCPSPIGGV